jgi:Tfp pilus assembly protein PilW
MKFFSPTRLATARARRRAMTLVEAMIAVLVMGVVIGGVLSANFLGMREDQLMESKAGASDTSRRAVNQMLYNIRSAKGFDIGTFTGGTNFAAITNSAMQGTALKLYTFAMQTNQVIDPNQFIIYYFDSTFGSNNGVLWQTTNTSSSAAMVASNLIAPLYFTAENYFGTTQSVRSYKNVIHTTLQFSQFLYPLTTVGSNSLYNYYRIDCRATPHIPDGP